MTESRRIVVACDSFKGTAGSAEIGAAIAQGWRTVRPDDEVRVVAMADGGEGTLDAIEAARPDADRVAVRVAGPEGQPVTGSMLRLPEGTYVLELADLCGLAHSSRRHPLQANTLGLGQALGLALDSGAERILVGLGGSASTDGGLGLLTALGVRALDSSGAQVVGGGGSLHQVRTIDWAHVRAVPAGGVTILSDVVAPLVGSSGAAMVFAAQKGASVRQVARLDRELRHWATALGEDPMSAGAGAAGGAGYGLLAWGAELSSGATMIAELVGLPALVAESDLVITGEGRFDGQSGLGKVPHVVAGLADAHGRPVALVAGSIEAEVAAFVDSVSLTDTAGCAERARQQACRQAVTAGALLARRSTWREKRLTPAR